MRKLLILENDSKIDFEETHDFVGCFMKDWKKQYNGEVLVFDNLNHRTNESIFNALSQTNDIAVQTSFINGSDYQLVSFAKMLSKIEDSKNIYIGYYDLKKVLLSLLTEKEIYDIRHHNIFNMSFDLKFSNEDQIDFSVIIDKFHKQLTKEDQYKETAKDRTTGIKVKILGCTSNGKAFQKLPIGEIVDTLDMSLQDPNPSRGVWVQGDGEPVKLVNDCGMIEYKIITETVDKENLLEVILKTVNHKIEKIDKRDIVYIQHVIDNPNEFINAGNEICDTLGIQRRGNRQRINELLNQ